MRKHHDLTARELACHEEWFLVAEPPDLEGPLAVSSVDPVVPFTPPPINIIPSCELPTQITESEMVDAIASPSQTPTGSLATVEKQPGLAPLEIPVVVKQAAAPMTIQREARPTTVPQAAGPVTIQRAVSPTMVQGSTASAHVACQRQRNTWVEDTCFVALRFPIRGVKQCCVRVQTFWSLRAVP